MKTCNYFTILFVFCVLFSGLAKANEKKKEYHKEWPAEDVATLQIINRFGEVRINNDGGEQVTIDVEITVETSSERKTNELLDNINVDFRKSGRTIVAETSIDDDVRGRKSFSINIIVNIPSDKNLDITNKYGNTFVNCLKGNGRFELKYGNFSANELLAKEDCSLYLAYGRANIGTANSLTAEVRYSPVLSVGKIEKMELESKYSTIEIDEAEALNIESKYDKLYLGQVGAVDVECRYSHLRVDDLLKKLEVESGYGSIRVKEVGQDFELVDITNSYGQIALGIDNSNYTIDAECEYCGISYPKETFSGKREKDHHTYIINGKIGAGDGGKVYIESRYGDINLQNRN